MSTPPDVGVPYSGTLLEQNLASLPARDRDYYRFLLAERSKAPGALGLFISKRDVLIVPGFMACQFSDTTGGNGWIWPNPLNVSSWAKLKLAPYDANRIDLDAGPGISIEPGLPIPGVYTNLQLKLEWHRCETTSFPIDWRKNLEEAARRLATQIVQIASTNRRPLYIVAHSQGGLVARRAIQILGPDAARRLVNHLVLLGPANGGTFSALFAIAGSHESLDLIKKYRDPGPGFTEALQSMTGLYQLLPYLSENLPYLRQNAISGAAYWQDNGIAVDLARLAAMFGWGKSIQTDFFGDRMTIILGDQLTAGGAVLREGKLLRDVNFDVPGDGTVPDVLARLPGVRTFRAAGASHMWMGMNPDVVEAVAAVILDRIIQVAPVAEANAFRVAEGPEPVPYLRSWQPPASPAVIPAESQASGEDESPPPPPDGKASPPSPPPSPPVGVAPPCPPPPLLPPAPNYRRLRVYSLDPLLSRQLETLSIDILTLEIRWEGRDGDRLELGPCGEYLEVVDFDPVSRCFYPPVDLNHPNLLAQDGFSPSEGHPHFHQQMVYAVGMKTIQIFEQALGRVALWAPRISRAPEPVESHYVPRLRIYPHALAQANAYYHPEKKAILFGYFTANYRAEVEVVNTDEFTFACLSYDVIAHEMTHALLDGLHRYYVKPTNPDVLAFHEAFADIVALFQHFSHPEVLRDQIARARGNLERENLLGSLAQQFGRALGTRKSLREYIGQVNANGVWELVVPDPTIYCNTQEPHARGQILVAAIFRAFLKIYEIRIRDLKRIASGGTGILGEGELHPDLVNRFAEEAGKAARHILQMCIRALDYVPPVDITFGEYLRALITADYDLIQDDDRRYRVAVIAGFGAWGIQPLDGKNLSVETLIWNAPAPCELKDLSGPIAGLEFEQWDRRIERQTVWDLLRKNQAEFHDRLAATLTPQEFESLGIYHRPGILSIPRGQGGLPAFQVHSIRPSRRVGPDGQFRTDLVIELIQKRRGYYDATVQAAVDAGTLVREEEFWFYGGSTLIVDPKSGQIRYCIRKKVPLPGDPKESQIRDEKTADSFGVGSLIPDDENNPFAALHACNH